jgi:hypothetical protein
VYPYGVEGTSYRREFPAELARAGEIRHFVGWLGAVAGLRGGSLSDLAIAAEASLTDVFLSGEGGTLTVESEIAGDAVKITLSHPGFEVRRMNGFEGILEQFLDGYDLSPTRTILVKRLK